jgi:hypothetical protein
MIAFLVLYFMKGSPPELKQIAMADLVCLPVLAAVAWLAFRPA